MRIHFDPEDGGRNLIRNISVSLKLGRLTQEDTERKANKPKKEDNDSTKLPLPVATQLNRKREVLRTSPNLLQSI
jgi:hypothetical protein